jgi:hypothetical protein
MSNLSNKKFNEQLRLFATALNTIAVLGFVSLNIVPYINGRDDVPWFWFPVAVCLHLIAHATLGLMKSED